MEEAREKGREKKDRITVQNTYFSNAQFLQNFCVLYSDAMSAFVID